MSKRRYQTIAWRPFQTKDGVIKYVHLEADVDDLIQWLGFRAQNNTKGQTRQMHGALRATIRNTQP